MATRMTERRPRRKAVHDATRIVYDIDPTGKRIVVPIGDDIRFPCGHPASPRNLTRPGVCFACPAPEEGQR